MSNLVDYAKSVKSGNIEDPSFSGFVFEIPADLDAWEEENWILANPALGDFRSLEDMQLLAERAKHMPTLEATFRNLFCNQRIDAEERWLPMAEWKACLRDDIDLDTQVGEKCIGGFDLSSVRDLTAFALYWPKQGILNVWTWCPADNIRTRDEKDRVPYTVWEKKGYIFATPGGATHKRIVAQKVVELCKKFKPEAVAFDRWGITEINQILEELGEKLPFEPFGQGYQSMSPATKAFENRVINKVLTTPNNPCLTWAVSNVAISRDASDNRKPNKDRSRERIDPAVAAIMAVGQAAIMENKTSVYATREMVVI
jgi:phage terminase large subunit-like protein